MQLQKFKPFSMRLRRRLVEFDRPVVMGIVNATPDSFYAPSRNQCYDEVKAVWRPLWPTALIYST